jgi:elongation factor 2
MVNFTIE